MAGCSPSLPESDSTDFQILTYLTKLDEALGHKARLCDGPSNIFSLHRLWAVRQRSCMSYHPTTHADLVDRPWNDEPSELEPAPARTVAAELLPLAKEAAAACRRHEVRQHERELRTEEPSSRPSGSDAVCLWSDAELQTELGVVQRIQAALAQRPGQLAAMEAYCDYGMTDWVSDCLFEAAERGHIQTAVALFDTWDQLGPELPAEQLGSKARLLLCGRQLEAAKIAAQARLEREPENPDALEAAADIFQACGDLEAAERYARSYVAVARQRGDVGDLSCALYTLADVLLDRGDLDAATALDDEADALMLDDEEIDDDYDILVDREHDPHCHFCGASAHSQPARLPVVRAEPKIGRNQPCLCGSGTKYKKCCGR